MMFYDFCQVHAASQLYRNLYFRQFIRNTNQLFLVATILEKKYCKGIFLYRKDFFYYLYK